MAFTITTTDEAAHAQGIKMLVYGRGGVGKTVLCATMPDPFVLSAEAGVLSLRAHRLPMAAINSIEDLRDAYLWASTSDEARHYQSLCLDSVTEIADKVLAYEKKQVKDPRQAYGETLEEMLEIVKSFRDLKGFHVYFSAQQEMQTDATGVSAFGAMMPGKKLAAKLPYLFDEVFQMGVGNLPDGGTYRFLRTQPDLQVDAKDRSGALEAIEQPDLGKIITKILHVTT